MLTQKAQELDALRKRREQLHEELNQIEAAIPKVTSELVAELHQDDCRSAREQQVLLLVRTGKTNKEIAAVLNICPRTVTFHISNLLHKAGVHDRHHL